MGALIAALVQNVLIPEITVAIRAHQAATGALPTDAQIIAALNLDEDRLRSVGNAWLASKGLATVPDPAAPRP